MSKLKSLIIGHKIISMVVISVILVSGCGVFGYNQYAKNVKEEQRIESAKDNASNVDSMIKGFKEVTLDKEQDLEKVNKAYKNLTKEEKGFVTEKKTLDKLNKTLASLKEQAKKDKEVATACINKINAIGDVTLDSEAKITDARNTYNALTEDQKKLVTNLDTLTNAESALSAKKEEQAKAEAQAKKEAEAKAEADKKAKAQAEAKEKANAEARKKTQAKANETQINNQTNNTNNANASTPSTNNTISEKDMTYAEWFSSNYPGYNSLDELPDGYNCGGMIWDKENHYWYKP